MTEVWRTGGMKELEEYGGGGGEVDIGRRRGREEESGIVIWLLND